MLHLTLRQLRIFESVARNLSFSRGAEELHLSQPAVSLQVKRLEEIIGFSLFEQLGKRIYLTDAGRELFSHSRSISQQLRVLEEALDQLRGLKGGRLKISMVSSTATYFASQLMAKFSQRYPDVHISLNVANRGLVLQQLADNRIDLAIMGQPPQGADLIATPFMKNPLVLIAPPGHRLARERDIPLCELEKETFLVREPGSGTRMAMENFFAERRIAFRPGMEIESNEAIKHSVHAGIGLSIVSLHTVGPELETLRLKILDVQSFPILRQWHVVHRGNKKLSAVAETFRTFLFQDAPQLLGTC